MDYGAADPSMNKSAPVTAQMKEGEMSDVGFGADSSTARPRGDRPARKSAAANPLATYRKGGAVKKKADGGSLKSEQPTMARRLRNIAIGTGVGGLMGIPAAPATAGLSIPAGAVFGGYMGHKLTDKDKLPDEKKSGGAVNRARGGRTKAKGTHVNVIIAPQGNAQPPVPPMPPPPMPNAAPAPPPGAEGPPKPPLGGMPPVIAGAPGGLPPGLVPPRARGGKVAHSDEAQDKALIQKVLKDEGLVRSNKEVGRASGGRLVKVGLEAGSATGEGRLEKAAARAKRQSDDKQAEL